jgi:hypothetical protein
MIAYGKRSSDCCSSPSWASALLRSMRGAFRSNTVWIVVICALLLPCIGAAEPIVISPNELALSYLRPASATEPIGDQLTKEWADVSARVLKSAGVSADSLQAVSPVHELIVKRAQNQRLGENAALLSLIGDLNKPSQRLAQSGLLSKLKQSRPAYGLLTRLTLRFSKSLDVSAVVARIVALDDKALSAIGLAGYQVRASGVQLVDYSVLNVDKDGASLPSGDPVCASSPVEKVAMIGVGFSRSGSAAPNESHTLDYRPNARCSRDTLKGDLGLQGAFAHGITRRVCPSCYTIAIDAGCGVDNRALVPSTNLAAGIVWGVLRDASTLLVPVATVNSRLPLNIASELDLARDAEVMIVAAAGDFKSKERHFPAAHPGIIGVGALAASGEPYELSNSGAWVSVSTIGVRQRTEYAERELRNVSGSTASAATIAARIALFRALQPAARVAEIVLAAQGSFFDKKIDFVCKERPDALAPAPGGTGAGTVAPATPSSAATPGGGSSSPPSNGNSGSTGSGDTSAPSGGAPAGSGGTGTGSSVPGGMIKPPDQQASKSFSDLGPDARIYGRNLFVARGNGTVFLGEGRPEISVPSGAKQPDGSLVVASGAAAQTFFTFRPREQYRVSGLELFSHPCQFQSSTFLVDEGEAVVVVALSALTVREPLQPVIGLRVSADSNEPFRFNRQRLSVLSETLKLEHLKQEGDVRYAIFRVPVEPRVRCLSEPTFELVAGSNVGFKVETVTVLNSRGYREDKVELPALSAGFKTQTGVREGLALSNQGKPGSLLHGPYTSVRERSFIRIETDLQPAQFKNCKEIYSTLTSPFAKFALANFQAGFSRIVRDISIDGNPFLLSVSSKSPRDQSDYCATIATEQDKNPLWRSEVAWAAVPRTDKLELRHLVPQASSPFTIQSVTAVVKTLIPFDESISIQSALLTKIFGRPEFVAPLVRVGVDSDLATSNRRTMNYAILGEFDGAGYRIERDRSRGVVGEVRAISAVSSAHHDSGELSPAGWVVSDSRVKQGARAYDQLLSFKRPSEQPVGSLQALVRVKQAQPGSLSFDLTLLNEVTKKSVSRHFDSGSLIRGARGDLWASIKLAAELSPRQTQYRFTVIHQGGSYELSKVVFLADKFQEAREVVLPALSSAESDKVVTHAAFPIERGVRVVEGLAFDGQTAFAIPTVQKAELLPIVDLTKPQVRIVKKSQTHYDFLTASLIADGVKTATRSLASTVPTAVQDLLLKPLTCRLPACSGNICNDPEVCSLDFSAIPPVARSLARLSFNQVIDGARAIQTRVDLASLVSSQKITSFRYNITQERSPEVAVTKAAYSDICGDIDISAAGG